MNKYSSPLRYPGGKSKISGFIEDIILLNNLEGGVFYELYAGGAGASLNLLFDGIVKELVLNDLDIHIYSFWVSILNDTERFLELIHNTKVDMDSWEQQRNIYCNVDHFSTLEIGFSTFFLNRCNRSGILYNAGPIGGKNQTGNYKIDVRFNKQNLIKRIKRIADYAHLISVEQKESITFLKEIFAKVDERDFVFLDPPYFAQGENLYLNFYQFEDHQSLRNILSKNQQNNWFLTYDNCKEINQLYSDFIRSELPMSYTLQEKRKSKEIMIFSETLSLPRTLRLGAKSIPFKELNS